MINLNHYFNTKELEEMDDLKECRSRFRHINDSINTLRCMLEDLSEEISNLEDWLGGEND